MDKAIFYHEDFYKIIELVSVDLTLIFNDQQNCSRESIDKSYLYEQSVKKRLFKRIISEKIDVSSIEDLLGKYSTDYYPIVETGYSTYRTVKEKTTAFRFYRFTIFIERNTENVVVNIWLCQTQHLTHSLEEEPSADAMIQALNQIGLQYSLLLTDWWQEVIVDLSSKDDIRHYFARNFSLL